MLKKVAYIQERFPEPNESFVANEIVSVMDHGLDCRVYSILRPTGAPAHERARLLVESGRVVQHEVPGRVGRGLALAGRLARQPGETIDAWRRLGGPSEFRWYARGAVALARDIERWGADHVHAHFAALGAEYAMAVHHWTGIPFTVTTHRYDIFELPPGNLREMGLASSGLICISEFNRRHLRDEYGIPEEKLPVIHMGVETENFAPGRPEGRWNRGTLKLLTVANLVSLKGHRFLLEAAHDLLAAGTPCEVMLAGDGRERAALEAYARQLGLGGAVRFLGTQTQAQVRALQHECDVFVLPSLIEGIPVCLMEAMACGTPVLATSVYGVPELVVDRVTGLLVPPGDRAAIVAALGWMMGHRAEVDAMTERARAKVVAEFDRATCTKQLIDLWQRSSGGAA